LDSFLQLNKAKH